MIDEKTRVLIATVNKLYSRGARGNVENILKRAHGADIAALLQSLSPEVRFEVFLMVATAEKRAETLSYLKKEEQLELLSLLQKEDVLTLVSLMDKDDAADLLGRLPEEESKDILAQMMRKDSEEVAGLLSYPEDCAGGLMSSEYFALNQMLTVGQAIEAFQQVAEDGRVTFYLYITNDSGQLVGVVSLKQLLIAKKTDILKSIMYTEVITVSVNTHQQDVAKTVERYDFLSVPVVDGNNKLAGVITVDDIIDVIRAEAEENLLAMGRAGWGVDVSTWEHFRARLPWLSLSFIGGALCFMIVHSFGATQSAMDSAGQLWMTAAFIPLILSIGATTGSQAATVAVGAIRAGLFEAGKAKAHLRKEMKLSILFGLLFGMIVLAIGHWLYPETHLEQPMALAVFLQILISMGIGSTVPLLMKRMGWDVTLASVPIFTTVADLSAVAVLIAMVGAW